MKLQSVALALSVLVAGCAAGPTPESPKANLLARASIMSQNERSITIRHSRWGQSTAFKWADEHCRAMGKAPVPSMSAPTGVSDTTSTWLCE